MNKYISNINKGLLKQLSQKHKKKYERMKVGVSYLDNGNIDKGIELIQPEAVLRAETKTAYDHDYYLYLGDKDTLAIRRDGHHVEIVAYKKIPIYLRYHTFEVKQGDYTLYPIKVEGYSLNEIWRNLRDLQISFFHSAFFILILLEENSEKKELLDAGKVFSGKDKLKYIKEVFRDASDR